MDKLIKKIVYNIINDYRNIDKISLDNIIIKNIDDNMDYSTISDGYHTFKELYYHRMVLFSVICNQNRDLAWKSKLHNDGTMYDNYFVVGIKTPEGQYTYHYNIKYWDIFKCQVLDFAPEWDGHKPNDIDRLMRLKYKKEMENKNEKIYSNKIN